LKLHEWLQDTGKRDIIYKEFVKRDIMSYKNKYIQRIYDNAWRKRKIRTMRNKLIQQLGGRCVRCFCTSNLELAHRDAIFRSEEWNQLGLI